MFTGFNDEILASFLEVTISLGDLLDNGLDVVLMLCNAVVEVEKRVKVAEPEVSLIDLQYFAFRIAITHYCLDLIEGRLSLRCLD